MLTKFSKKDLLSFEAEMTKIQVSRNSRMRVWDSIFPNPCILGTEVLAFHIRILRTQGFRALHQYFKWPQK